MAAKLDGTTRHTSSGKGIAQFASRLKVGKTPHHAMKKVIDNGRLPNDTKKTNL